MEVRTVVSTSIEKPIRDVFMCFADPKVNAKVDAATRSARLLHGEAYTKGAVWRIRIQGPLGIVIEQTQWMTQVDAPYRQGLELAQPGMKGEELETFEVEPSGAVHVTWDARYRLSWWMVPLAPMLRRSVRSQAQRWIDAMKTAIEAGQRPITPVGEVAGHGATA